MSIQTEINRIKTNINSAYTAISAKGGTVPTSKTSANLSTAVDSIALGTNTSDATAAASDILSGKTAYVKGSKVTGTIASKSSSDLTASGSTVSVPAGYYASAASKSVSTATQATPSVSVDANGLVTASATQSAGYVSSGTKSGTLQLTTQAAQTITPGTTDKTIASGRYLTGTQTIKGDPNLISSNIKSGISIFGVTGRFEGGVEDDVWWDGRKTEKVPSAYVSNVIYKSGVFCVFASDKLYTNPTTSSGDEVLTPYYSTDGITWTKGDSPLRYTGSGYRDYSNVMRLAISSSGLIVALSTGTVSNTSMSYQSLEYSLTSTDGKTWTKSSDLLPKGINSNGASVGGSCNWYNICYGNGYFVATGLSKIAYSSDGKTWTKTSANLSGYAITFGMGKFIASTSGNVMSSTYGQTWSSGINVGIDDIEGLSYGNGKFVAISKTSSAYSTDGSTWIVSSKPLVAGSTSTIGDIQFISGLFVVPFTKGGFVRIGVSVDGDEWAVRWVPSITSFTSFGGGGASLYVWQNQQFWLWGIYNWNSMIYA